MINAPQSDPRPAIRSNVNGGEGVAWKKVLPARNRKLFALERAFHTQRAKLIKPAARLATAKFARETEASWQRAALKAGSSADRRQALKLEARNQLEQKLLREIPGFRAYLALKKKYLTDRSRILGQAEAADGIRPLKVQLGALDGSFTSDAQEFVAPFPRGDLSIGDLQGALKQDRSQALPGTGQLVQDFFFEHNESSWGASSSYVFVDQLASCGVDFTLPTSGRLQVAAEIENFANRLDCSITDNFGFSHSNLEMWVNLFIAIVRFGVPRDYQAVRLISSQLSSDGDDLSRSISDLATFEPYAMGGLTLSPLPAGETVTVLAGAHVRVASDTDDMNAHVHASYWWHLRKLTIGVI
jgi:hypothetical protein